MTKQYRYSLKYVLLVLVFAACVILNLLSGVSSATAYDVANAADNVYSDVITDLRKDASFNISNYPTKANDNSLSVIQIAESVNGELFIYTYQPSGKLRASSINIAREMDNSVGLGFRNYFLQHINSSGVFFKYKVKNFTLRTDAVRYYNISNILRPFDNDLDDAASGGNTISEVPFAVGQFWTACTVNGDVTYNCQDTTVIEITQKYVGFVDLFDGIDLGVLEALGISEVNASHTLKNFVAFSTDLQIDKLKEVELQFSLADYTFSQCANPFCAKHSLYAKYDKKTGTAVQQEPITIKADEVASNNQHGILGNSYTWKKIQSTADFLADNNNYDYYLTTEGVNNLSDTQWVLNFYDVIFTAKYHCSIFDNHLRWSGENVSDVIILRLKFETAGKSYNLGVVDNKQTGSDKPINRPTHNSTVSKLNKIWKTVIGVIVVVIIILVLVVVIKVISLFKPSQKVNINASAKSPAKKRKKSKKKGARK